MFIGLTTRPGIERRLRYLALLSLVLLCALLVAPEPAHADAPVTRGQETSNQGSLANSPTIANAWRGVQELPLTETDPDLARALTLFTRGTVGDLFNHPSNIPTDNPLLGLDLSALLRADDEVLERLIPVIVMDFFVNVAINRPTGRRSHLVLDEAHALLYSEAGSRTMQTIFRIGRSLQFKATLITQSLSDLDESEQTRVRASTDGGVGLV